MAAGDTTVGSTPDWDGDGQTGIGVYDASKGLFLLKNSLTPGAADIRLRFSPLGARWLPIAGSCGDEIPD